MAAQPKNRSRFDDGAGPLRYLHIFGNGTLTIQ
jgi:hypothetical protein